jgi:hypothetical protein
MHAASLFRSISPISGYIYDIDPVLSSRDTFCVEGTCIDAPGAGKGMFLHHSLDDETVRSTGCCKDSSKPTCCCGIAGDTCISVMAVVQNWAHEVNGCALEAEGVVENISSVPGAKFIASYTDQERGVECLTATGKECKSNTTICLYNHSGHFNRPSFNKAFPLAEEVIDFFAKDACKSHEGKWNETSGVCTCPENRVGVFCSHRIGSLVSGSPINILGYNVDSGANPPTTSNSLIIVCFLFTLATWYFVRNRFRKQERDKHMNSPSKYVTDQEMGELIESESSRQLHTNC